tara:strand:+ start:7317 stop:7769 length:453 start_codon:yes stop_codon:yes gene_type:complete
MNKLTNFLLIISFCFSSFFAFASSGNNWDMYYEDAKVKISYQKKECNFENHFNQEFVLIKIENLTSNTILLKWDNKIWYDESCINCEQDNAEFRKEIRVERNQTIKGNCSEHNALRIFSKFTDKLENMPGVNKIVKLTNFELKNLKITYE